MSDQWLPTKGDNVRVTNPERGTYGTDGVVVRTTGRVPHLTVLVRFGEHGHLFHPNELDLLR